MKRVVLPFFLVLLGIASAWAVPNTIRVQGRLTNSQGQPIVGDSVKVRFLLYTSASGGGSIWDSGTEQTVTANEAGLFSTEMGPVVPNVFAQYDTLYLEIVVRDPSGPRTLAPRQKFSVVPYAYRADFAVEAASAGFSSSIANASVSSAKIAPKAIVNTHLSSGSVDSLTVKDGSLQAVDLSSPVTTGLIPHGMIAMFAGACPAGWSHFELLDNHFPLGSAAYDGIPSGSTTISGLTVSTAGGHTHVVDAHTHKMDHYHLTALSISDSGIAGVKPESWPYGVSNKSLNHRFILTNSGTSRDADYLRTSPPNEDPDTVSGPASPSTNVSGAHQHAVVSDGTWLPPYVRVVYCEKN